MASSNSFSNGNTAAVISSEDCSANFHVSTVMSSQGSYANGEVSAVIAAVNCESNGPVTAVIASTLSFANSPGSVVMATVNSAANSFHSAVVGGSDNQADGMYGIVAGGSFNWAGESSAVIGGYNNVNPAAFQSFIAASDSGNISFLLYPEIVTNAAIIASQYHIVFGNYSLAGGGRNNTIMPNTTDSVVMGGFGNTINGNSTQSFIAACEYGNIRANDSAAFTFNSGIVGGFQNNVGGSYSFIGGGLNNSIPWYSDQTNWGGAILGGINNVLGGTYSTILGGQNNVINGSFSLGAGSYAYTANAGTFVWSDASLTELFPCNSDNAFCARAFGGVVFVTGGTSSSQVGTMLPGGGTSWMTLSDKKTKREIVEVDYEEVLDKLVNGIPISTYSYIHDDSKTPHMGPMAQDFHSAFGLGGDDKRISTQDADGVALAAIHGLHQRAVKAEANAKQLADTVRAHEDKIIELSETIKEQQEAIASMAALLKQIMQKI